MRVSKAWLQEYFETPLPHTEELVQRITFGIFEIEGVEQVGDDEVLDIKVLPDRSSYCLSHRGIAKEIAALTGMNMKNDSLHEALPKWQQSKLLAVQVDDTKLCPRYMGAVVRGVSVGPSPAWLRKALETLGQRSINNIVDATNFVMYNLGQPLHAFDFNKLTLRDGHAIVQLRMAHEGENITLLTGEVCELDSSVMLVADGVSGNPLAVAGVKGGKHAEIDATTTDIILEAANFNFVSVRKTSRKLKVITDASVRFQNEPSPELVSYAMHDVIKLITAIAKGGLEGVLDVYPTPHIPHTVQVSVSQINALLGTAMTSDDVASILKQLGFIYTQEEEQYTVTVPFERTDLNIKEDLIEEVGRVYGYENIPSVLPVSTKEKPLVNKHYFYIEKIRRALAGIGFSEVYTYTLRPKGDVELENPLASDKAFLCSNLTDGMHESLALNAHNAPLLGLDAVKIFEIGTVFTKKGEHTSLAIGIKNMRSKKALQGMGEQVRGVLSEALDGTIPTVVDDGVSEINFDDLIAPLPDPKDYEEISQSTPTRYTSFSSYPFVLRDIALWVPEGVEEKSIVDTITQQAGDLLVRSDLFDTFKKEGRVSYAFHLVFQSKEKTLTDIEINAIMDRVVVSVQEKGWEVR